MWRQSCSRLSEKRVSTLRDCLSNGECEFVGGATSMTPGAKSDRTFILGCSTLAFSRNPLEEALEAIAEMGFRHVDLGAVEGWAHVNPSELVTRALEIGSDVRGLLERFSLTAIAANSGLGNVEPTERQRRFRGLLTLAREIGAPVITLPARGESMEAAIKEYTLLAGMARDAGVQLTVETHRGQLTEFPRQARELVRRPV